MIVNQVNGFFVFIHPTDSFPFLLIIAYHIHHVEVQVEKSLL